MRPLGPANVRTLLRNVFLVVALTAGIGWGVAGLNSGRIPPEKIIFPHRLWQLASDINWKSVLYSGMPVMSRVADAKPAIITKAGLPWRLLFYLTRVKINNPVDLLSFEIPLMAAVMPVTATDNIEELLVPEDIIEAPGPALPGNEEPLTIENKVYSGDTLIALYTTHSSETYELTDGVTHLKGKAGGVTVAAAELARVLRENYKIKIAYTDKIHDTSFGKSYVESEKTAKSLVQQYPKLQMLIDIHRDGLLPRERTVTEIKGQKIAKILLVVGTDARAAHPHWRKNLEFARQVAAKMDRLYPGLSRGIAIKDGRYNQQYHARGLLVEIGSAKNTTDESVRSAQLFANVLVAVLNDIEY